jgi:ABC-2 type transport system ATP-binding protein
MSAIEISELVKNYGKFPAVKGISFHVKEKEIFGLIGPNAAGKTTTLRILATLLQLTNGSVKVFGFDITREASHVRKIISYLPEDAGAYKNLTGWEYLRFIAHFFGQGHKMDVIVKKGQEIANLGDRIHTKVDTYSKGMMRRLLVGRALMVEPKLAILDEPTSGLDVRNAQEIRHIIKKSVATGATVLLSSHNMLEVEFLCDRIALINKGYLVESGSPQGLKRKYGAKNIEEVFTQVVT